MKALLIIICLFLFAIDAYSCGMKAGDNISSYTIQKLESCIDYLDEVLIKVDLAIKKGDDLESHLENKELFEEIRNELEKQIARIEYKKKEGKCAKESASAKSEFSAKLIFKTCMGR